MIAFDVFGRPKPGAPLIHLGALEAPDEEFARFYATQVYARRGENCELVISPQAKLTACAAYDRVFDHHAFQRVDGYSRRRWLGSKS